MDVSTSTVVHGVGIGIGVGPVPHVVIVILHGFVNDALHPLNQFDTFLTHFTGISKLNGHFGIVTHAALNAAFIVVSSSISIFNFAFHEVLDNVNCQIFIFFHHTSI
jgi:hypothetical protein